MKKVLIVLLILLFCCSFFVACNNVDTYDDTIVVMSYNVRVFSIVDIVKDLSITDRWPYITDKVETFMPDVLGLQEATQAHMSLFEEEFGEIYDYVIDYRSDSSVGLFFPEATPIFFKRDKFELLDSGTFWLSETPDIMSKGWDANHFRICTFVKLKVKVTNDIIYFYNTHLDFGAISVPSSVDLIIDRMELDYPCVLMGDFNFRPTTSYYDTITEYMEDSRVIADDTMLDAVTHNGFSTTKEGKLIDYIFLSKADFVVSKYLVSNDDIEAYGIFASDHYPVIAYINLAQS